MTATYAPDTCPTCGADLKADGYPVAHQHSATGDICTYVWDTDEAIAAELEAESLADQAHAQPHDSIPTTARALAVEERVRLGALITFTAHGIDWRGNLVDALVHRSDNTISLILADHPGDDGHGNRVPGDTPVMVTPHPRN